MSKVIHLLRYANTLSLDVAIGAVVSASFFSSILNAQPTLQELICLGLIVWMIYTVDHLVDASRIASRASTHRHYFHQKYFTVMTVTTLFIFIISVSLLFFIRESVMLWGSVFMLLVITYFFYQHKLGFLKEFFGAILYTGGVILPSVALLQFVILQQAMFFIMLFAITAWINLILFSWFSHLQDKTDNHCSLVLIFGPIITRFTLYGLFAIQFGLMLYCAVKYTDSLLITLILLLMNMVLFMIFFKPAWFIKSDRYRVVGDAMFSLPIIYFFM